MMGTVWLTLIPFVLYGTGIGEFRQYGGVQFVEGHTDRHDCERERPTSRGEYAQIMARRNTGKERVRHKIRENGDEQEYTMVQWTLS